MTLAQSVTYTGIDYLAPSLASASTSVQARLSRSLMEIGAGDKAAKNKFRVNVSDAIHGAILRLVP